MSENDPARFNLLNGYPSNPIYPTLYLNAVNAQDTPSATAVPAVLSTTDFPDGQFAISNLYQTPNPNDPAKPLSSQIGIIDANPENTEGPCVLQLMRLSGEDNFAGAVDGRAPSTESGWTVTPVQPVGEGGWLGGDVGVYLSQVPPNTTNEPPGQLYLSWGSTAEGSPTYASESHGLHSMWTMRLVLGAPNETRLMDWLNLVVINSTTPGQMLTAIWNKCANEPSPWSAAMGATLLSWVYMYPLLPNVEGLWLAEATDNIYCPIYKKYIEDAEPGWGDGNPPLPPPPGVK